MDDAKIILTAVYDRLALSIEGDTPAENELAELAGMFTRAGQRLSGTSPPAAPPATASEEIIPVSVAGTTTMLCRSAVRFIEAQGDYARLHTSTGSYLIRVPLAQLEARWANAGFLRIHRSFIVSLPAITEIRTTASGYTVRVGTGDKAAVLPVSRRYGRRLTDQLRTMRPTRKGG